MEHVFNNARVELFFGVLILFFSFTGVLAYIRPDIIINVYYLLLFFIGIMLGSLLLSASMSNYFKEDKAKLSQYKRSKRKYR